MPQLSSDNHIQILKFDTNTTASTLTELVLENVVSGRIEGYTPAAHMTKCTKERPCDNNDGAFHVRYFSSTLPQNLCFALASIVEDTALKNTRYFAPQHTIILPELNTLSPPNSQDTKHAQYQLFGTVVHTGNSPQTGHFSAYVLRDNHWFFIDDEYASQVSPHIVIQPPPHHTIFMLFYKRTQGVY